MSTIVLRSVKGVPLTNGEVDANFSNLNTDKTELGGTYSSGTANGVLFLSATKVLTTGSALTFDGTNLGVGIASALSKLHVNGIIRSSNTTDASYYSTFSNPDGLTRIGAFGGGTSIAFDLAGSEQMRLTSTGLGIGTSSPLTKLDIKFAADKHALFLASSSYSNGADLVATNDTGSEIALGLGGNTVRFYTGATERMRLDSSGNLGLGVTPSAQGATYRAINLSSSASYFSIAGQGAAACEGNLLWNARTTGNETFAYMNTGDQASRFRQSGQFSWHVAPSGTAGNAISFSQVMTLDASGNLGIGTSSPGERLNVVGGGSTSSTVNFTGGSNNDNATIASDYSLIFQVDANNNIGGRDFNWRVGGKGYSDGTSLMTLNSSGNLGLGVTPSAWGLLKALDISSSGSLFGYTAQAGISNNSYFDGSNWRYKNTNPASFFRANDGAFEWQTAPSGTAGNAISFTQAMTLNASGNLGVGTTSPGARIDADGNIRTIGTTQNRSILLTTNAGTFEIAQRTDITATLINSTATPIVINTGGANYLAFGTNGTERARIDASGNMGIGTSSPGAKLHVSAADSTYLRATRTVSGSEGNIWVGAALASNDIVSRDAGTGAKPLTFVTGTDERARITSGGYSKFSNNGAYSGSTAAYHEFYQTANSTALLIRATDGSYGSDVLTVNGDRTTTNASYNLINAYNGAVSGQFLVRDSGNALNTNNSYGAISDAKLKENVTDATPKLEKLSQVRVVNFNLIGQEQKQLGVIAQELEQIFPGMVDETPDRDAEGNDLGTTTKSVKYSVFVPMLIKAIQEQQAIIESLKARLDAANL